MHVTAIVLAAGQGVRFTGRVAKLLVKIRSHPAIAYSLKTFQVHPEIKDIILVVNAPNKKALTGIAAKYRIKKIKAICYGGRLRQDSVAAGLGALGREAEIVLIHDGARPFVDKETISRAIQSAKKYGAAIAAVPVKATIKEAAGTLGFQDTRTSVLVERTLDRDTLWEAQTPQVFKRKLILEAYRKFGRRQVTDDAALAEKVGAKVRLVMGSYSNIKITTPEDLIVAKAISRVIEL